MHRIYGSWLEINTISSTQNKVKTPRLTSGSDKYLFSQALIKEDS